MLSSTNTEDNLVYRLRKRAEIRRQISTRKSVQNNEPDRIADLLEEAANEIERLGKLWIIIVQYTVWYYLYFIVIYYIILRMHPA